MNSQPPRPPPRPVEHRHRHVTTAVVLSINPAHSLEKLVMTGNSQSQQVIYILKQYFYDR
jgi:hypothetical protein